ncbi:putative GNAT family acetyltransferase [Bacilli bacterium PM5-3]|nr:putative GNAT family acetyltransferase [Bacilli bacterium PM5-3]MDH6603351.1 putative GNAT family acetyltransferase [Bacilli bacterium PM5-9]
MKCIKKNNKFVLEDELGNFRGEMTFKLKDDNVIVVDHTYVPKEFAGQGYARVLLNNVVEYAKENNFKILPVCAYVKSKLNNDSEYNDIEICEE